MNVEKKLKDMGIKLEVPKPVANYVPAVASGNLLFVSGTLPMEGGKLLKEGRVGESVTPEEGKKCAEKCAVNSLAYAKSLLGDLNRIKRVVRVEVFVASSKEFHQQPLVANGASDFFVRVFDDAGKHSRIAVGVESLPLNSPVEVGVVFEIE